MPNINGTYYPDWRHVPSAQAYDYLRQANHTHERAIQWMDEHEVGSRVRGDVGMPITKKAKTKSSSVSEFLNTALSYVVSRPSTPKKGELYGLELELEGTKLTPNLAIPGWLGHNDGSLRGASNVEWVSSVPGTYDISRKRVDRLFKALSKSGAKLKNSYRTSTHVHLNYSDKYAYQIINMFVIYTILEDILARYCGDERKGNLFCLGARDAEDFVRIMESCTFRYNNFVEYNNDVRYAGLNLSSLNKFGTIELRTMRGVDKPEDCLDWLEVCKELYQWSLRNTQPPSQVIESVSMLGPRGFVNNIFSRPVADRVIGTLTENELHTSLYDGLRLIQMYAYQLSNEWKITQTYKYEDVKMKDDEEAPAKKADNPFRMAEELLAAERNARPRAGRVRPARPVVDLELPDDMDDDNDEED